MAYWNERIGMFLSHFFNLAHWGRDKMDAISQTTSTAFSWMKMLEFRLNFQWSLFLMVNIPSLVQIMAWRRPGDRPLSEPMMVSWTTYICVTRPQWVNLNDISPGISHPLIQCGARPLTGDLPTTAPSPLTFEFWKHFLILLYCLCLYCRWSAKSQLNT